ncbi:hemagglutinin [Xylella fastidiosa]|uniref:hemagglutinin n=1 Tax=Xylella fastidiosa TaxID=2371 RepID=UPI003AFAF4C0
MIVNYVQQQGATAIGHWVATGQLTEGSPLHAALHALLACAGAAASQQRCSSGAQGAAASSVLTGLFSDPRPEDTAQDREAKRNLITSIVTGIASSGNTDPATATHAAIAAVDNNWLAAKQYVQMVSEELEAATEKGRLEEEKVRAKWREIDARQDKLTVDGLLKGLKESGISNINGLEHLILHPVDVFHELEKILIHPTLLLQLGERAVEDLLNKVSRMSQALLVGGDQRAEQFGEDLGSLIVNVGVALAGAGTVKAAEILGEAGISLSKDVLEGMATFKANQLPHIEVVDTAKLPLPVQYEKYVDNAVSLIDKRHPNNQFIVSGRAFEPIPYDPNVKGGSNKAGNVKVFPSEVLTDKEIREYAETWAQGAPFKEMIPGVYVAKASDGTKVTLRSVSSSDQVTKARWTIDIKNNPKLKEVTKETVEFKFR